MGGSDERYLLIQMSQAPCQHMSTNLFLKERCWNENESLRYRANAAKQHGNGRSWIQLGDKGQQKHKNFKHEVQLVQFWKPWTFHPTKWDVVPPCTCTQNFLRNWLQDLLPCRVIVSTGHPCHAFHNWLQAQPHQWKLPVLHSLDFGFSGFSVCRFASQRIPPENCWCFVWFLVVHAWWIVVGYSTLCPSHVTPCSEASDTSASSDHHSSQN